MRSAKWHSLRQHAAIFQAEVNMFLNNKGFCHVADALREAGYVRLPPLWIKRADMGTIRFIADQYADDVNHIRGMVNDHNRS